MYKGEMVILRPFEKEHLEAYRKWVNDPDIGSLIDRALPVSREEHERWYAALLENRNAVVFAIETGSESRYIGNILLWDINWQHRKAELRILIGDKNYQGKGLGVEAIKMLVAFVFGNLNLNKVYAYVLSSNERAKKAFERSGFSTEGTLKRDRFVGGKYQDVFLMAILRQEI